MRRSEPQKSPTARSVVTPESSSASTWEATMASSTLWPSWVCTNFSTAFCEPPPPSTLLGIPVPKRCACMLISPGMMYFPVQSIISAPVRSILPMAAILPSSINKSAFWAWQSGFPLMMNPPMSALFNGSSFFLNQLDENRWKGRLPLL